MPTALVTPRLPFAQTKSGWAPPRGIDKENLVNDAQCARRASRAGSVTQSGPSEWVGSAKGLTSPGKRPRAASIPHVLPNDAGVAAPFLSLYFETGAVRTPERPTAAGCMALARQLGLGDSPEEVRVVQQPFDMVDDEELCLMPCDPEPETESFWSKPGRTEVVNPLGPLLC